MINWKHTGVNQCLLTQRSLASLPFLQLSFAGSTREGSRKSPTNTGCNGPRTLLRAPEAAEGAHGACAGAWRRAHAPWPMPGLAGLSRRLGGCARLTCLAGGRSGGRRRDSARGRSAAEVDEVGGRTRKWVGASARGSELAAPSRRGSPGFPVIHGPVGGSPAGTAWEGKGSRASAGPADPGAWGGSACSGRPVLIPLPAPPPRAALLSAPWLSEAGLSRRSPCRRTRPGESVLMETCFPWPRRSYCHGPQHPDRDRSPGVSARSAAPGRIVLSLCSVLSTLFVNQAWKVCCAFT